MSGLTINARWPAISARRSRRISSSLLPLNIGPQTTSSQPPACGCVLIMRRDTTGASRRTRRTLRRAARCSFQEPRHSPVLEDAAAGLARGAVVDRVLVEIDAGDRRAAPFARAAELVVDTVGLLVVRAGEPQLEPAVHLRADRGCETCGLRVVDLRRECIRRELRGPEDLVRPRAADAGDQTLITEQRMQPAGVGGENPRDVLDVELVRLGPEVRELGAGGLRRQQPDSRPLLRPRLRQLQLAAVGEADTEHRGLRAFATLRDVLEPPRAHQVDE